MVVKVGHGREGKLWYCQDAVVVCEVYVAMRVRGSCGTVKTPWLCEVYVAMREVVVLSRRRGCVRSMWQGELDMLVRDRCGSASRTWQ